MITNVLVTFSPVAGKPSCLQTTLASLKSQESSHTVPHTPDEEHTSTLPCVLLEPPTSLSSPSVQFAVPIIQ